MRFSEMIEKSMRIDLCKAEKPPAGYRPMKRSAHGGYVSADGKKTWYPKEIGTTRSGKKIKSVTKRGKTPTQSRGRVKLSAEDHADMIDAHMAASDAHHKRSMEVGPGPQREEHRMRRDAHYTAASNHHIELHGSREMGERPTSKRKPKGMRSPSRRRR